MLSETALVRRPAMLTASRAGWSSSERLSRHKEGPRPWQGPQNQTTSPTLGWSGQRMPRARAGIPVRATSLTEARRPGPGSEKLLDWNDKPSWAGL